LGTVWIQSGEALDFPLAIAIPAIPVSVMLRSAGKRRALSVLESVRYVASGWREA